MHIADDRLLARCAFEAVGWNIAAAPQVLADIAVGNAMTSLRVLGVAAGPEILRTVRSDVDMILADPAKMARAAAMVASLGQGAGGKAKPAAAAHPMRAAG